jgi:folate-dependent phosphoribosylglycinamide formyltransferase PurN
MRKGFETFMEKPLKVLLLAYPDNPIGSVFIETFLRNSVPLTGVLIETKKPSTNWKRIRTKIRKDGLRQALLRIFSIWLLKIRKHNVIGIAMTNGIRVYPVDRFNSPECASLIASLDIDLLAIASAPILKSYVFEKAKIGCLNAHPGWLPKFRGVGANRAAILQGEMPGVCIHFVDAGIDTGKIIQRERLPLRKRDTIASINDRASARGAELMARVIQRIRSNGLQTLDIDEPIGDYYPPGRYGEIKRVNRLIRRLYERQERDTIAA